ncbi:MAG: Hpt domain-containing protein, partial [Candidatus Aminicenantes bacterium]|nr:Hpt domain-containing protein [Candidatus Aminicenantes bacterium]
EDMDFLEELIDLFMGDFKEKYSALKDAVKQKDALQIQEIAHNLKGSSANLGLTPLQETFFQLETAGRNDDLSETDKKIDLLQSQFTELINYWENRDQIKQDQNESEPKAKDFNLSPESRILLADDSKDNQLLMDYGKIKIDESILDLVPTYLGNRRSDIKKINTALEADDISIIESLAHKMKGSGTSYGFEQISLIGKLMESAAKVNDRNEIQFLVHKLQLFLEKVRYE